MASRHSASGPADSVGWLHPLSARPLRKRLACSSSVPQRRRELFGQGAGLGLHFVVFENYGDGILALGVNVNGLLEQGEVLRVDRRRRSENGFDLFLRHSL